MIIMIMCGMIGLSILTHKCYNETMIGIIAKSEGRPTMDIRVFRASKGEWEKLPLSWWIRQWTKEIYFLLTNPFLPRSKRRYATVVTDVGEQWIVDKLDETVQTNASWVAWGTGAGTAGETDTALFTEAAEARVSGTLSQPTADTMRVVGTITSASAQTITNGGTFTASAAGTLVVKGDFTGIVLANGDKIEFTVNLQIT